MYKSSLKKSMIVLTTGVLLVNTHTHDNHRLLSYHDNGFCYTIITISMLLHITSLNEDVTMSFCIECPSKVSALYAKRFWHYKMAEAERFMWENKVY